MSNPAIVEKLTAAWNGQNVGSVVALYSPDGALHHPMVGPDPLRGREAIAAFETPMFAAFSAIEWKALRTVSQGDTVAVEYLVSATNTGTLQSPKGPVPPTGRRIHIRGASMLRLAPDGTIAEERRYFDAMGMMAQLGLAG